MYKVNLFMHYLWQERTKHRHYRRSSDGLAWIDRKADGRDGPKSITALVRRRCAAGFGSINTRTLVFTPV